MFILDRVLYTSTHYPSNYGFIPRTYDYDDDPLDVLVLCSEELETMSLVRCYPIGIIKMIDNDKTDDKIIAIPFKDPNWNSFNSIDELPKHYAEEIKHFFEVYKNLEHKTTTGFEIGGRDEALKVILECKTMYDQKFNK